MRAYRKVNDQYEFRVDGGRLALFGVGAALVVLLVFLLGVLVGKALWGGRRIPSPAPLAEVVPPPLSPGEKMPAADEPKAPPRPEYTFYEELKKPEPDVAPPSAPPDARRPAPNREAGGAAAVAAVPAPSPPPQISRPKPAPRPPPAVFTVQVGSFRERTAASSLAGQVGASGVRATVTEAAVAGRTWYRVQVGRFETRSDAESYYRKRLRNKGIQGFVTTR